MNVDIFSRAHRALKALPSYRDLSEGSDWPAGAPQPPALQAGEVPVGAYFNESVGSANLVFFSTEGVYVYRSERWELAKYRNITRTVAPESKDKVSGFMLSLHDGSHFWLPIVGSKSGRFFDAFEVIRFVDRVLADLVVK